MPQPGSAILERWVRRFEQLRLTIVGLFTFSLMVARELRVIVVLETGEQCVEQVDGLRGRLVREPWQFDRKEQGFVVQGCHLAGLG
jgi:hypothetical protein